MADRTATEQRLTLEEVSALMKQHFPQVGDNGKLILIDSVDDREARLRLPESVEHLRPGGTVSGPAMVMLADVAVYVAILATLGEAALQAVTTSLNINFLRRPAPGELIADAKLLKVGRRLVVGEVAIADAASQTLLAHTTATYALPDRNNG
ncbi:MAG TPA: PaaI family thioesterase [Hyphomicrobiaceae bacterium]|nr:PaaI family thioesterase [Hyphomicrobiaceae bacterium]